MPDQRGYNISDKPESVSDYRLEALGADALGILDEGGHERALVVGDDWGAVVAWWLALAHPERVERLAILNVPHPAVMRRFFLRSPRQMRRSWYIYVCRAAHRSRGASFRAPSTPEGWGIRDRGSGLIRGAGTGTFG